MHQAELWREILREHLKAKIRGVLPQLKENHLDEILRAYSEEWRSYHNSGHPLKMLYLLKQISVEFDKEDLRKLQVMIIYHDVDYIVGAKPSLNERRSAVRSSRHLNACGESLNFTEDVYEGILATITHTLAEVPERLHHIVSWLIDIDMFVSFGSNPRSFWHNNKLIEDECLLVCSREALYENKRSWAQKLLEKDYIFINDHFRQYEKRIRDEIKILAS